MVLVAASGALARAQVLDDFKDRDRVREWKVVSDAQVDQPSLCKIDVQGAAMLVLEGMGGILPKVDVFIIESNVFAPAGDDVHQIMAFLGARKFVLYDIADVIRRPIDNALGCLDLVFVKEDSRFRRRSAGRRNHGPLVG